jgi:uncharacterized protein YbjT (DUF2867 family)
MRVIITGTTGMIGEGILLECLRMPEVTEILSVSRKPTGKSHPKLKEHLVPDFLALAPNDPALHGYDACFFCAGISSIGVSETDYERLTYDTTMSFARAVGPNPSMSFVYVSGSGTDSTEKGRLHWARVKGKTENDLMKLGFRQAFGFRIGMVEPAEGQVHVLKLYTYLSWLMPVIRLFPSMYNTMAEVAHAMYAVCLEGFPRNVIHVGDIHQMSKEYCVEAK